MLIPIADDRLRLCDAAHDAGEQQQPARFWGAPSYFGFHELSILSTSHALPDRLSFPAFYFDDARLAPAGFRGMSRECFAGGSVISIVSLSLCCFAPTHWASVAAPNQRALKKYQPPRRGHPRAMQCLMRFADIPAEPTAALAWFDHLPSGGGQN
jgi:hypothetical protein